MGVASITLSDLNDYLYDLIAECIQEGCVAWSEQYMPEHPFPQTTLKLKDAAMPRHPVDTIKGDTVTAYYECTKILEVNRYANSVAGSAGEISTLDNPAVDDLTLLLMYLQSEAGTDRMYAANVCIEGMGPVRDLSELDRTHYMYRAMQEYTVRFMLEYADGNTTVHVPPGRENWEQVKEPIGYFEEAETEETYE